MRSRINGITAALAVLATLGSCTANRRRTPDDTLVLVVESAIATADSRYAITGYDRKLAYLVVPGLTVVDSATLEPELLLASKVTRVDDLTWDVEIRTDAKFSDGLPVRAEDVAGTYRDLIRPKSDSMFHKNFNDRFSAIDILGPHAVRFHLKAPLATFMTDIDFGIVSFHHGTPERGTGIGAGPYFVKELDSSHVLLEANPHYFGAKAKTRYVDIKIVRDAAARLLMLVGGSADLVQNAVRLDLVDEVAARPRVRVETGPSVFLTYLLLNNTDPFLRDKRVRQAIALALDRPQIIAAKFGGRAQLADGLLPKTHWAYSQGMTRWSNDPARAKRLLDEAGFKDPDGDGPQPRFTLSYKTSSDAFRIAVARVIAAQLAEVGIEIDLKPFEFATFFADVKKGRYQLASMQTAEITEPDFYFTYFHSSWIPTAENPDGYNRWRYINPEVDRLTMLARRELDRAKRVVLYDQIQRIVADDVPVVPLFHEDNVVLINQDVEGYRITPNARLIGLRDASKRIRE
jgi:peptide/nickel transport system substrate-binding protein